VVQAFKEEGYEEFEDDIAEDYMGEDADEFEYE
jgi:hypothetical protein